MRSMNAWVWGEDGRPERAAPNPELFRAVIVATYAEGKTVRWTDYIGPYLTASKAREMLTRRLQHPLYGCEMHGWIERCEPVWERYGSVEGRQEHGPQHRRDD